MFVYEYHETSLYPLETTKGHVKEIIFMWSRYDGHFEFATLRMVIMTLDTTQGQNIE